MINSVRCILALGIVYMPVLVLYGMTHFPKITRSQFALIMSFAVGLQLFLLTIMFVEKLTIIIGLILFLLAFLGGYPSAYFLYPRHKARVEKRLTKKS